MWCVHYAKINSQDAKYNIYNSKKVTTKLQNVEPNITSVIKNHYMTWRLLASEDIRAS